MVQPVAIDPNAIRRTKQLVDDLLDRDYFQAIGSTLDAIGVGANRGAMGRSLDALQAEALRLSELGQQLTSENTVLRMFRSDLDDYLRSTIVLIDGSAEALQAVGIEQAGNITRQLAFGNLSDDALNAFGVVWNSPDPEALQAIIKYVDSEAWQTSLSGYQGYINGVVENILIRDFAMGVTPFDTVMSFHDMMRGVGTKPPLTISAAESLTRSLQLTAHRDSQALHQVANADIISRVIRIAALDDRTCLTCIALHGTELQIGERVDDHRRGRCISITEVKGRPRIIEGGEEWFNSLPDDRRFRIAGGANFNALEAGAVTLPDFVKKSKDPIFGDIVQENSLVGVLGKDAEKFYVRNQ